MIRGIPARASDNKTESKHIQLSKLFASGILAAHIEGTPSQISFSNSLDCLIFLFSECSVKILMQVSI